MSKKSKIILISILIIAASIGAGFLFGSVYGRKDNPNQEIHYNSGIGKYKFINPLLECDAIENLSNKKINDIKSKVQDLINEELGEGNINFASVYFRDLNNGPWFGINEKEEFMPGSLLKVPLMISIFKIAESNHGILQEEILYQGGDTSYQYFKPEKKIEPGKIYTVEDLIEAMIKYSDNSAAVILSQYIAPEQIKESYIELGVEVPLGSQYFMSVRTYATFFRILYNATYLNREFSEKALEILSQATFKDGLRGGVPPDIAIAHKFGEKDISENNTNQLHNCGIIYEPNKPYLLCVMSRGNDFEKLACFIKNISSVIYDEMKKPED